MAYVCSEETIVKENYEGIHPADNQRNVPSTLASLQWTQMVELVLEDQGVVYLKQIRIERLVKSY